METAQRVVDEDDMWALSEYDDISDVVRRHYVTHSEAIGEVLKNTADIEIAAGKVKNIVSRLMNSRFVGVDSDTKKKLATAILCTASECVRIILIIYSGSLYRFSPYSIVIPSGMWYTICK